MQWDDLRVFLAVAQAGSLRRAGRALGLGQPTVVRRLRQLEHALGARLAGLAGAHRDVTVELAETHVDPDLDRREADLFIRHGLPTREHLVRVALGTMALAVYGEAGLVAAQPAARTETRWRACPWVAYDTPHEYFRSMAWLGQKVGDRAPRVRANRLALQHEAIRGGAGLGLLPCFVGDADPALARVTPPIADLTADYWLVVHPDLRAVGRVRRVTDWIRSTFRAASAELQGRRRTPVAAHAGGR